MRHSEQSNHQDLTSLFNKALTEKNHKLAKEIATRQCSEQPDSPDGPFNLWLLDKELRPLTLSIDALINAYHKFPNDKKIQFSLAQSYMQLGIVEKASSLLFTLTNEYPEDLSIAIHIGRLNTIVDLWGNAFQHFKILQKTNANHLGLLNLLIRASYQVGDKTNNKKYIKKLRNIRQPKPIEEYNWAVQNSVFEKRLFTQIDSQKFRNKYPDSLEILRAHMLHPSHPWQLQDNLHELNSMINSESYSRKILPIKLELLLKLNEYEEALELISYLNQNTPHQLRLYLQRIHCLRHLCRYDEATETLDKISGNLTCPVIIQQQITLNDGTRNREALLPLRWKLAKMKPSFQNITNLYHALWENGKVVSADCLIRYIEKNKHQHWERRRSVAAHAFAMKDFEKAEKFSSEYLRLRPLAQAEMLILANSQWQNAKHTDYYFTNLALMTHNPAFIGGNRDYCYTEELGLKEKISQLYQDATTQSENFESSAYKLSKEIRNPYHAKILAAPNFQWENMIRDLCQIEKTKDYDNLKTLSQNITDNIITQNPNPVTSADVLYRLAVQFANAEQYDEALSHLNQALLIKKYDPHLYTLYKTIFSRTCAFIHCTEPSKQLILMVSCQPNLKYSRNLAKIFNSRSSFQIILLTGNPNQKTPSIKQEPFGYELSVPSNDDYLSLPEKLVHAFRYLSLNSDCTGILKIDDDMIPKSGKHLLSLMSRLQTQSPGYAGVVQHFSNGVYHYARGSLASDIKASPQTANHDPVKFCNGGKGYYLSRSNIDTICLANLTYFDVQREKPLYEDVFFGEILHRYGIHPHNINIPTEGRLLHDIFEGYKVSAINHSPV